MFGLSRHSLIEAFHLARMRGRSWCQKYVNKTQDNTLEFLLIMIIRSTPFSHFIAFKNILSSPLFFIILFSSSNIFI